MLIPLAVLCAACGDDNGTDPGPVATNQVSIIDDAFQPDAIRVSPGTTVTWTWNGANTHNVNFASASITDGPSQATGTYAVAMPSAPGTYAYQCDFHTGMTGSVLVQ